VIDSAQRRRSFDHAGTTYLEMLAQLGNGPSASRDRHRI